MKLFKNKKVVLASAIVLGVAAVTSSALAAYIITGGNKEGKGTIDPSLVEVENNVVDLTVGPITDELIFRPADQVTNKTVTSEGGGSLSVTIPLTLTADESKLSTLKFTIQVTEENTGTKNASDATENFVTLPGDGLAMVKTATDLGFGSADLDGELELVWGRGTKFGNTDPCSYYNEGAGADDDIDDIVTTMEAFETAVNGATFKVTISVADAPSA